MARTQSGLLTSSSWNRSHSVVGFVDAVDVPALSRSLQSLVDRHCALRTAYTVSGPVVQQPGEVKLILQVAELAEIAGAKWDEQYRWICFKANEPFDIQSPKTKCKALLRAVIASSARGHRAFAHRGGRARPRRTVIRRRCTTRCFQASASNASSSFP